MSKCGARDTRGYSCIEEAGHSGEHWFLKNADVCDLNDERGYACTLHRGHEGDHRFGLEVTPRGSAVRIFRVDDDPEVIRQRELDALNPADPITPDNSDLEDFAHVLLPRDQVALWAGRIVSKEAQIESMLQSIYCHLRDVGLNRRVMPRAFGPLLDDIREMLMRSDIEDATYIADCVAALDRLKEAHLLRNAVVHEQWVMRQEAPGEYVAVNVPKGIPVAAPADVTWALHEFRQCYEELRFCAVMISGVFWSIGAFVGESDEMWRYMVPSNREEIAGRIALQGENHWEFTDQAFATRLREEMNRKGEEFRREVAEQFGHSSPGDLL